MTLSGRREIQEGERLQERNGFLYQNGLPVCIYRSDVAKHHFARNDDGKGMERGKLTYAIAYSDRVREWEEKNGDESVTRSARMTPEEAAMIRERFPRFVREGSDALNFSDAFFLADIEDLKAVADSLGIL